MTLRCIRQKFCWLYLHEWDDARSWLVEIGNRPNPLWEDTRFRVHSNHVFTPYVWVVIHPSKPGFICRRLWWRHKQVQYGEHVRLWPSNKLWVLGASGVVLSPHCYTLYFIPHCTKRVMFDGVLDTQKKMQVGPTSISNSIKEQKSKQISCKIWLTLTRQVK